jgi:topoisomerase IV subunit A
LSYDGRNREPITLPVKFPYLLTSGIEGIAVGLACKMLPHNFIELIDGSINILKGKKVKIYPDFPTGGLADFSEYNDGLRGGRIKVRSRIAIDDKKTLRISEVPYGTTTSTLIDSILKANDKGKIKIRKVEDNTAEFVEILVHLTGNESPDKMIDALYAFTDCEVSIAPNAGVIENDKPRFIGVSQILEESTEQTKELLKLELQIEKGELQEKWHFASLEKIFIEKRIYRDIEECETWEEILSTIHRGLEPHVKHLIRPVTDDDVTRLTEIRIKRISKFDGYKADEYLSRLEEEIARVQHHLDNLVEYAIDYFKNLKKKYGEGRERKTEIRSLETIERAMVAASNVKLYVQYNEGFVGHGLKKTESEFVCDASDIDDIIVIRKDGVMVVTKMNDKTFVGKDILYCNIWKKDDERTTYNMVYQDGSAGKAMVKRFNVTSIVRDREYDLTAGSPKSKVLHLTVNPNGEAEVITVILRAIAKLKKLKFDFDFAEQAIKGRAAKGNILSKYVVNRIDIKEHGISTLSARKVWFDESIKRLNYEERGQYLGAFNGEDKILTVMQSGHYRMTSIDVSTKFDDDMIIIEKWNPNKPISAIYFDPDKEQYYVKRFLAEDSEKLVQFIAETEGSRLEWVSVDWRPMIEMKFDQRAGSKENELINVEEVIAIKGLKAQGNRIAKHKIKTVETLDPLPYEEVEEIEEDEPDDEMDDSDESLEVDEASSDETEEKPEAAKPVQKIELPAKEKPETTSESLEAETPKPEKEKTDSAESGPKKPKLVIKAKKDDDEDSFGAGSQITLEL